jgi:hypothetical protein
MSVPRFLQAWTQAACGICHSLYSFVHASTGIRQMQTFAHEHEILRRAANDSYEVT